MHAAGPRFAVAAPDHETAESAENVGDAHRRGEYVGDGAKPESSAAGDEQRGGRGQRPPHPRRPGRPAKNEAAAVQSTMPTPPSDRWQAGALAHRGVHARVHEHVEQPCADQANHDGVEGQIQGDAGFDPDAVPAAHRERNGDDQANGNEEAIGMNGKGVCARSDVEEVRSHAALSAAGALFRPWRTSR
jgi:hypothetical protein